jgi:large subunit ribosomal protein L24
MQYSGVNMKKDFAKNWVSSKLPRKQRKYRVNAPLTTRRTIMKCNLSPSLRKKYDTRNVKVRKGDMVKILRGKHKGKKEKINRVDTKKYRLYLDNIVFEKKDGTKIPVPIHYSNVQIWELNLSDKKRVSSLNKKTKKVK